MIINHLTDDEVQQYALNSSACNAVITAHILICEECKTKAENYQLLFAGIKQQPEPVFDFNLHALVLAQLPKPKPRLLPKYFGTYLLITASLIFPAFILFILQRYWGNFFADINAYTVFLIIITVVILLAVLCIDIFRTYRKKMNSLNYY